MRAAFGEQGFVVRDAVFTLAEVEALQSAAEEVASAVTAHATREGAGPEAALGDGHRIQFSSRTAIQWEWADDSRAIRLLEPCSHLDARFAALFGDDRLLDTARAELGGEVAPFTSKLELQAGDRRQ